LLAQIIDPAKCVLEVTAPSMLATEVAALVNDKQFKLVCIGALPPGGLAHARYLCKRLRLSCPDTKIVVGRWGLKSPLDKNREQLAAAGADYIGFSLSETRNQILNLLPVVAAHQEPAGDREAATLQPVRQSA
jgi:hypothetical protein